MGGRQPVGARAGDRAGRWLRPRGLCDNDERVRRQARMQHEPLRQARSGWDRVGEMKLPSIETSIPGALPLSKTAFSETRHVMSHSNEWDITGQRRALSSVT